jgi:hypothetical protein
MSVTASRGLDWATLTGPFAEAEELNRQLATERDVSRATREATRSLVEHLGELSEPLAEEVDPYLVLGLQKGMVDALLALDSVAAPRAPLRVAIERIRQALRDMVEGEPVSENRPAKDVARWLASTIDAPQTALADLIGTSARTWQRWVSPTDSASPVGEDARRIRVVARIAAHLRHALTGPGVIAWFNTPRQEFGGLAPSDLLKQADAAVQLERLASRARSMTAT